MEKDTASVGATDYPKVEVEISKPETVGEFEGLVDDVESDVPALAFRAFRVSLQSALRNRLKTLVDDEGMTGDALAQRIQAEADEYVYGQRPEASRGTVDVSDIEEAQTEDGQRLLQKLEEKGFNVAGMEDETV